MGRTSPIDSNGNENRLGPFIIKSVDWNCSQNRNIFILESFEIYYKKRLYFKIKVIFKKNYQVLRTFEALILPMFDYSY
jgi:hypothetical protein